MSSHRFPKFANRRRDIFVKAFRRTVPTKVARPLVVILVANLLFMPTFADPIRELAPVTAARAHPQCGFASLQHLYSPFPTYVRYSP